MSQLVTKESFKKVREAFDSGLLGAQNLEFRRIGCYYRYHANPKYHCGIGAFCTEETLDNLELHGANGEPIVGILGYDDAAPSLCVNKDVKKIFTFEGEGIKNKHKLLIQLQSAHDAWSAHLLPKMFEVDDPEWNLEEERYKEKFLLALKKCENEF